MLLHFLPGWPEQGIMLHRLVQEVKGRKVDHDVAWPAPCALLDLLVERLHRILPACRPVDRVHEHAWQHLIKDDTHGPDVELVTIARTTTPLRVQLLRRHHQW